MPAFAFLEPAPGTSPGPYTYIEPGVLVFEEDTVAAFLSGYDSVASGHLLYMRGQLDIAFNIGGLVHGHGALEVQQDLFVPAKDSILSLHQALLISPDVLEATLRSFILGGQSAEDALDGFIRGYQSLEAASQALTLGHGAVESSQLLMIPSEAFLSVVMEILTRSGALEVEN